MQRNAQGLNVLLSMTISLLILLSGCTGQDRLPFVSLPEPLPQSMKEYELYNWKADSVWRFTLITGTNRLKTVAEVTSLESTIEDDWVKITVEGIPDLESDSDGCHRARKSLGMKRIIPELIPLRQR